MKIPRPVSKRVHTDSWKPDTTWLIVTSSSYIVRASPPDSSLMTVPKENLSKGLQAHCLRTSTIEQSNPASQADQR